MDNQLGLTVEHKELNVMCQPGWESSLGRMDILYMYG